MGACDGSIDVTLGLGVLGLADGDGQLLGAHAATQQQQVIDELAGTRPASDGFGGARAR